MADGVWLVVGLGNPGPQYAATRHNAGWLVVEELAGRHGGGAFRSHRARAAVAEARLGVLPGGAPGPRVILAKPAGFMNTTGGPVAALVRFYGDTADRLVVVHDDLDLPFGQVRLKRGGGEGGHNGLRSVSSALQTRDYLRVRVGIGRPPGRMDPADFVLRDFSAAERPEVPFVVDRAADAVECLVLQGLERTQQRFHGPG